MVTEPGSEFTSMKPMVFLPQSLPTNHLYPTLLHSQAFCNLHSLLCSLHPAQHPTLSIRDSPVIPALPSLPELASF